MNLTDFISSVIGGDAELASFSSTDELDEFLAVSKSLNHLFENSSSIRLGLLYEPADDILLGLSRNQSGACGLVPIGNLSELHDAFCQRRSRPVRLSTKSGRRRQTGSWFRQLQRPKAFAGRRA
uniref:GAF domain-containing protein n=1 Tax=Macrostomum lignano TaxID=282301 RepID=A0A1I8GIN1_9PLAT